MAIFAEWAEGPQALTGVESDWFDPFVYDTSDGSLIVDAYTTNYNAGTGPWSVTLTTSLVNNAGQVVSASVPIATYTTGFSFHYWRAPLDNGDLAVVYDAADSSDPSTGVDIDVQIVGANGQTVGTPVRLESNLQGVNTFYVGSIAAGGATFDLVWDDVSGTTETVYSQVFNDSGAPVGSASVVDSFPVTGGGEGFGFGTLIPSTQSGPTYIYLRASNFGAAGAVTGLKYELVGTGGQATTSLSNLEPNYPISATADTLVGWTWTSLNTKNGGQNSLVVAMRYSYQISGVTSEAIDVRTLDGVTGTVSSDVVISVPTSSSGEDLVELTNGDFVLGYGSATGPTLQAFDAGGQEIGSPFALPSNETNFKMAALSDNRILIEYPSAGGNQLNFDIFNASDLTPGNDLVGDGLSDILWRNTSTGQTESWLSSYSGGYEYVGDGTLPLAWQVAGSGDFNGDGAADILWRNTSSGDTYLYLSNGSGGFTYSDLGTISTSWQIAGVADFNGDGLADIIWRNTANGDDELWLTKAGGGFSYENIGAVSTDWQIAGTGDFNGDGRSDILWRNTTTGVAETWFTNANGTYSYANDGAPSLNWQIAGTGDFNGDGDADILWRNTSSGDTYLYQSNGSGGLTYQDLGVVSTNWQIAQVGDFNGDGLSDILWRNTSTGEDEIWMTKQGGGFNYVNAGTVSTSWTVAS